MLQLRQIPVLATVYFPFAAKMDGTTKTFLERMAEMASI